MGVTAKVVAMGALAATMVFHVVGASAQSPQQIIVTATLFSVEVDTFEPPTEGYNLDIALINPTSRLIEADVRLVEGPDGWQASLFKRVDALTVNRVMLPPGSRDTSLDFHFIVPPGTENGDYVFRLGLFDGDRLLDDVEYTVTVAVPPGAKAPVTAIEQVLPGGFELDARFPNQQGRLGERISFAVTLRSRDVRPLSFTLGAEVPPGWRVAYKPSFQDSLVGALSLTGGGSQNFDVEVVPPSNAEPGVQTVVLRAVSEGLDPVKLPLEIELSGVPDVRLTTESGRLTAKVTAGDATDLAVLVVNSGGEAVDNLRFLADAPSSWTVTLGENPIPRIEAGETFHLAVTIEAPEETIPGDYNLRLVTAVGGETVDLQFRITAIRSSAFGFIGIAIIIAVVGGLAFLFARLGRR